MRRLTPSTIPRMIPETAMNVITGTYRKISFLTPVRDVKVVEPVKFRARYAVTAGIMRRGVYRALKLAQPGRAGAEANAAANGIATTPPRRRPFVEKSFVGMNGSRTGKEYGSCNHCSNGCKCSNRAGKEPEYGCDNNRWQCNVNQFNG